jgi:hypothetical protein
MWRQNQTNRCASAHVFSNGYRLAKLAIIHNFVIPDLDPDGPDGIRKIVGALSSSQIGPAARSSLSRVRDPRHDYITKLTYITSTLAPRGGLRARGVGSAEHDSNKR